MLVHMSSIGRTNHWDGQRKEPLPIKRLVVSRFARLRSLGTVTSTYTSYMAAGGLVRKSGSKMGRRSECRKGEQGSYVHSRWARYLVLGTKMPFMPVARPPSPIWLKCCCYQCASSRADLASNFNTSLTPTPRRRPNTPKLAHLSICLSLWSQR